MNNKKKTWDTIIIGGGAAGLMAAASAARNRSVLVLEKNRKLGVKILMSGGTRCNITHDCGPKQIAKAIGPNGRFLHPALGTLPPKEVIRLIESMGVATKSEATGKIFPVSNRAIDVRDALVELAVSEGAEIKTEQPVQTITSLENGSYSICTEQARFDSRSIILTTGGKSFPGCGTTGDGYAWAQQFGHTIITTTAALTPIRTTDDWPNKLKGITLEKVGLKVIENGTKSTKKPLGESQGSFLFTHFGFSGPAAMNISRAITKHPRENILELVCDFRPDIKNVEVMKSEIRSELVADPKSSLGNLFSTVIPKRVILCCLERAGISPDHRAGETGRKQIEALATQFKSMRFPISGTLGFKKAEVTAGGVCLSEIDNQTMQSRLQPGLFFAGEIIDIDGPIGGYNFQAAFSTGWLAGENV